jgi:hypothetical protein
MLYRYISYEEAQERLQDDRRAYLATYYQQRRIRWRERGKCGYCGKKPKPGLGTCERCLKRCRAATARYREKQGDLT